MRREIWNAIKPPSREAALIDLATTPIQSLARPEVYGLAELVESISVIPQYRVSIYRPDEKDLLKGFPINTDHYQLWEGFPDFLDLSQIVNECTTSIDPNLLAYIEERVFLIKERPADDDWLRDYPSWVKVKVDNAR
jgi:hypothetical protein